MASLMGYQPQREPVPAAVVRALTSVVFTEEMVRRALDEKETCPICFDEYKTGDEALVLGCHHRAHSRCLLPWFDQKNTCPFCRAKIEAPAEKVNPPAEIKSESK